MATILQDLRHSVRSLRRAPGFTAVAVVTLALGIGANTTMFSVIDAALLRPTPHVADPDRLVHIFTSDFSGPAFGGSSYPDYIDIRDAVDVFTDVTAVGQDVVQLTIGESTERLLGEVVTGNYFGLLGVTAAAGRTLLPADDGDAADHGDRRGAR